jgi:hypothetical protein
MPALAYWLFFPNNNPTKSPLFAFGSARGHWLLRTHLSACAATEKRAETADKTPSCGLLAQLEEFPWKCHPRTTFIA